MVLFVPETARVTVLPLIGLENASRTVMVTDERLDPLLAVIGLVAETRELLRLTGPAAALAVKVIGLPVRPAEVAVIVLLLEPATVPRVQPPSVATPEPLVNTLPLPLPPPAVTAK